MKRAWALAVTLALALGLASCRSAEAPPPEPPPAPAPPAEPEAKVELTVTSRVLNLREDPTAKSPSLGQLKRGDKVGVLEERGGWARVRLPDARTGWVDARYVRRGGQPCLPDRPFAIAADPPFRMSTEGPHGRVVVEADVGTDGAVKRTRVVSNPSGHAELAARAESELKAMKFSAPVRNCRVQPFIYSYTRSF